MEYANNEEVVNAAIESLEETAVEMIMNTKLVFHPMLVKRLVEDVLKDVKDMTDDRLSNFILLSKEDFCGVAILKYPLRLPYNSYYLLTKLARELHISEIKRIASCL